MNTESNKEYLQYFDLHKNFHLSEDTLLGRVNKDIKDFFINPNRLKLLIYEDIIKRVKEGGIDNLVLARNIEIDGHSTSINFSRFMFNELKNELSCRIGLNIEVRELKITIRFIVKNYNTSLDYSSLFANKSMKFDVQILGDNDYKNK